MFNRNAMRSIGMALAILAIVSCDDEGGGSTAPKNFPASRTLQFDATNNGPDNMHFYMDGGDRSNSNRVAPGKSGSFHTTPFTWTSEEDFVNVKFEASNNLGHLAFGSVAFTGKQLKQGRRIQVSWPGNATLIVTLK